MGREELCELREGTGWNPVGGTVFTNEQEVNGVWNSREGNIGVAEEDIWA